MEEHGVWVYFPWNKTLVHLLDQEEFLFVRTNRNRDKITEQEQQILAKKKIGIIGLSVGQSVALTLAMERSVGELRLADFDCLELSKESLKDLTNQEKIPHVLKIVGYEGMSARLKESLAPTCFLRDAWGCQRSGCLQADRSRTISGFRQVLY